MTATSFTLAAIATGGEPPADAALYGWAASLAYLLVALLLIAAANDLARPTTAARGIQILALGVVLAIVVTFTASSRLAPIAQGIAAVLGAWLGKWLATKAKPTEFMHRSSLFTALGGLSTAIVGGAALLEEHDPSLAFVVAIVLAGGLSSVAFGGSLVAYLKSENPQRYVGPSSAGLYRLLLIAVGLLVILLGVWLILLTRYADVFYYGSTYVWMSLAAAVVGALVILPKNDSCFSSAAAVMIAAAAFAVAGIGFALDSSVLIIVGAVVGASTHTVARRLRNESVAGPRA
jgi:NAD(P) transhydrogenase subunit beta